MKHITKEEMEEIIHRLDEVQKSMNETQKKIDRLRWKLQYE